MISPFLAAELEGRRAGAVALPTTEADVVAIVGTCARHGVPIVPRGAGTGTFGQAVPMAGGVVVDLSRLTGLLWHDDGAVRVRAGTLLGDIDAALAGSGGELRMFPSSRRTATAAGFVVGGHGGIGSIRHGVLGDRGNLLGLRLVTVEAEPQVLELRGDQADLIQFSMGTAGIVVEVEFPLTQARAWRDMIFSFPSLDRAVEFAHQLTLADGLDVKNAMPCDARSASYFTPLADYLPGGTAAVLCMVAPHARDGVTELAAERGGAPTLDVPTGQGPRGLPLYEYTWGHCIWWIRKEEKDLAVVLSLLPVAQPVRALRALLDAVGEPVWVSVPCQRIGGQAGLQVGLGVDASVPDRVQEVTAAAEKAGCLVADIHRPYLGEGSIRRIDERREFMRNRADPQGLCNPGRIDRPSASPPPATPGGPAAPPRTGAAHGWSERFDNRSTPSEAK
jgi:FAD/FMN-containing dehydrogenase